MILYHNFTVAPVADNAGYLVTIRGKSPFGTFRPLSAGSWMAGQLHAPVPFWRDVNYQKWGGSRIKKAIPCPRSTDEAHDGSSQGRADGRGVERAFRA